MDGGAILEAIFNNPAVTALLGVFVGSFFDIRRRAEDRPQRQIDRERAAISDLQFGLAEMLHGTWIASLSVERAETEVEMARIRGASPIDAVKDYPNPFAASWHQEWLAAIRKVGVMRVRATDPKLRRLVDQCMAIAADPRTTTPEHFEAKHAELTRAVAIANERAGNVYRTLGETVALPWYRRVFQSDTKPQVGA